MVVNAAQGAPTAVCGDGRGARRKRLARETAGAGENPWLLCAYRRPLVHEMARRLSEEVERGALLPLPQELFPFFHESERADLAGGRSAGPGTSDVPVRNLG